MKAALRTAWFPSTVVLIVGLWVHTRFVPRLAPEPAMPAAFGVEDARALYLVPGGKYTVADIAINGGVTAAEKYHGFRSRHDLAPLPGDHICPVTRTKADPRCTWVVGGKDYQFCCPPCIDEFVRLARERPDAVAEPDTYRR